MLYLICLLSKLSVIESVPEQKVPRCLILRFKATVFSLKHILRLWTQAWTALLIIGLAQIAASAATPKPILISQSNSTRALALDALEFTTEPFTAKAQLPLYSSDKSTRIMLFAIQLSLQTGEDASAVTADAEDSTHHHYSLKVERLDKLPEKEGVTQLILILDENMGDLGDVLVSVTYKGLTSNRVRVGI